MNSNSDLPGRADLEGRLRRHLDAAGAAVGSPELDLDGVRRRGRRRRTAVRSAVATTSVVALVAVGLVALRVTGGDGDEDFTIDGGTPVADSPASTVTAPADAEGGWTTVAPIPATTAPADPSTGTPTVPIDVAGAARSASFDVRGSNIAPWRDGFVRLETRWEAPAIGEWSDDVVGGGQVMATIVVDISDDGITWESVGELAAPDGVDQLSFIGASGDRLVVVGNGWDQTTPATSRTVVASTLDLRTWDTVQELDSAADDDLPTGFSRQRWVSAFDAGPSGVAIVESESRELVVEDLVPADVRDELLRSTGGYSTSIDTDGFTIEVLEPSDEVTAPGPGGTEIVEWSEPAVIATYTYSWDEVGVDPEMAVDSDTTSSIWSGDVVDGLVRSDISELGGDHGWASSVVTGADGVVWASTTDAGPKVFHSTDGLTWTERTPPIATTAYIQHLGGTPDGLVLIADDGGVPEVWVADGAAQDWERGDASQLAAGADGGVAHIAMSSWGESGHATLLSYDPAPRGTSAEIEAITLERGGYRLTTTYDGGGGSMELVRIGTDGEPDEVVVQLVETDAEGLDSVAETSADGSITFFDPAGEPLVTFTADDLSDATSAVLGSDAAISSGEPWSPTFVLVVTEDGRTWRVLDRIDPEPLSEGELDGTSGPRWPSTLVMVDRQVLLGLDGGETTEYRVYDL